jgi:acyl-CoA thioester hydrolase
VNDAPETPQPTRPVPTAGAAPIRVRYSECDPMGVAHHSVYAPWLEIGRTDLLRETGVTYADLERAGVFLVIVRLELKYRRPIYYDDVVEVRTKVAGGSAFRIEHEYEIALSEDGGHGAKGRVPRGHREVLTTGSSTLVCVGRDGRAQHLPGWLSAARHEPGTK